MRIALASDAWHPQVNGVVRSLSATVDRIRRRGIEVETITADQFRTLPCPTYPEIRLAFGCARKVARRLDRFAPDAVHIATEGPVGWATRRWCRLRRVPFTTSFHTRFPDYVAVRTGLPAAWFWPVMRYFHGDATRIFAVTPTLAAELQARGIGPVHHWPLGVDLAQFSPLAEPLAEMAALPRPIMLNVGRVAVEKNLDAFLSLDLPGTKVIVGDGPALEDLRQRYPDAVFLGAMHGRPTRFGLCGRRCFRLSKPDRYVRPGQYRGAGEWLAGGGFSGARPDRHPGQERRRAPRRDATDRCARRESGNGDPARFAGRSRGVRGRSCPL